MVDKVEKKLAKIEQLLKEVRDIESKRSTQFTGAAIDVDTDAIADKVFSKVMDKISREGIGTKLVLPPPQYILETFQEKEIQRWEEKLNGLDEEHFKLGAFVIAYGKQVIRSDVISKVFGSENEKGDGFKKYSKKADELVQLLILRTDSKKRLYPNIEETVKENLKLYEASDEKVKNVIDRITRIFIDRGDVK